MSASLFLITLAQAVASLTPSPDWQSDYPQAMKRALAAGKPLAIVIGNGPSGWDQLSVNGGLSFEARRLLKERYICLYVDASQPVGKDLAKDFAAKTLPTVVLSDKHSKVEAYRKTGKLGNTELDQALTKYVAFEFPKKVAQPQVRQSYYQPTAPMQQYQPNFAPSGYGGFSGGFGGGGACRG